MVGHLDGPNLLFGLFGAPARFSVTSDSSRGSRFGQASEDEEANLIGPHLAALEDVGASPPCLVSATMPSPPRGARLARCRPILLDVG
eukprot:99067-Prorocentrum_minimum.AAC.1